MPPETPLAVVWLYTLLSPDHFKSCGYSPAFPCFLENESFIYYQRLLTINMQGRIQDFTKSFSRLSASVHNHTLLGESGGMPPQKIFEKWPFLRCILAGFQVNSLYLSAK